MKLILLYTALLLLAASCGGDVTNEACAGSHVGAWSGVLGTLTLTANCDFSYRSSEAASAGVYSPVLGDSGTMLVEITSSTGAAMGVGSYECAYAISDDDLLYDCGSGEFSYSR